MRQILLLFTLTTFLITDAAAQQSVNMNLLGQWNDTGLIQSGGRRYSDVWGYAANGREYALIGSREFVIVLDVTDPANIVEIDRLNTFTNSATTWRDIKVYGDYAYFVVDVNTSEGLQVIDLRNLPTSVSIVHQSSTEFQTCHNLAIDTTASPVRLYAFGTNAGAQQNGYIVYSLADPAVPDLMASVNLNNAPYSGGYIHDAYAIHDTLYANHGPRGMYVYDLTNPAAPVELGVLANYDGNTYNHSNWRTADGKHVIMCDETTNKDVKIVNVENPSDMEIVGRFNSQLGTSHLAHNPYVLGDSLVVMSYYEDGVQVWDIRDRANPQRLGYYDTSPAGVASEGVWGAYPYLPSGNILASDMRNGLFIVEVDDFSALPVSYGGWEVSAAGKDAVLRWQTTEEVDNAGWEVEHATDQNTFAGLGFVAASTTGDYSFIHATPGPGTHYYRLRQRDFDGTERLSDVRAVQFSGAAEAVRVYPNPAVADTPIRISGLDQTAAWSLHDASGREILRGRGPDINQRLVGGAYFLHAGGKVIKLIVKE